MSRHADSDDSSNEGSGTDSEEDQKPDEMSSRSEGSSESDSGDETEETESRYMVQKNDPGDKRTREDLAAVEPAAKKLKTLGGGGVRPTIPTKSDSQIKTLPANRTVATAKTPPVKKPVDPLPKKPGEAQAKKKEPEKEPTPKKTPQNWSSEDEIELISRILSDMKTGIRPPKRGSRGDNYHYWGDLLEACRSKFITDWSKEQLYDKYRRIKMRYDEMVKKERSEGITALKFKNPGEEKVYKLWKEIYDMQEQEESEPPSAVKPDANKKTRTPPPLKSSEDDTKKDVASTSKKPKPPAAAARQEPKQNGSVSEQRQQQQQPQSPPPPQAERNLTVAAMNELQKKSNAALSEMQGKIDEIMNDFHARSQGMVQEAVKGAGGKAEWLNEWLTFSMARGSATPFFGMEMLGGIGTGWIGGPWDGSSPTAMKLKEHWLKQQEDELRVMEQRVRLLQDLCRHQQELLKARGH
ncbi:bromodomain-containing protein 4 [Selaginella moellendorffii]|nr:bromodomain-containing protein 4 [Selaginella moellendorffii]XP_024527035.1 bromodomain-containing protein 4 [Selaginella moellendorffii]XP_024527036.1 bromodomain-containing protein 4 [Selaginella moellendorffii]XP_024527037.1 bromodomain-containing protein 4 [Selaginella moellendorffii]|eukprot:XP_024527034.1 bromodomain-containing protein 4 [Selaginella moellendorffii]